MSRLVSAAAGLAAALYCGLAAAQHNLQPPVTPVAREIFDLHLLMLWICAVIFVGVFSVMFYSIYAHRKSVGHKAVPFHENTTVEIVWTIVPFFILIGMAWPATKAVLTIKDTSNSDITIKATGYQWKWGYDYLKGEGEGVSLLSNLATPADQVYGRQAKGEHYLLEVDQHLVVPVGKRIRLLLTAGDVIHAWWVPAFGVKQDAIPGFVRDTWFKVEKEGIYRGQCAELCGKDHGFMPIVVEVVSPEKYAAWVADQKKKLGVGAKVAAAAPAAATAAARPADDPTKKWAAADLVQRGEKIYTATCAVCHGAKGEGNEALKAPALAGSKIVAGPPSDQLAIVLYGKQGTAMQPFGGQLSDTDIAAVVTYTRNAWGSKPAVALVQPAEVKSARK
jgi:cytochrome c oxidase subunit 2